jgi:8-oxo-dGTP diphosphatase
MSLGMSVGPMLAAGCLVWRVRRGRLEVLMVHRPRYDDWSWPKGKLKARESLVACAARETAEEVGRPVVLGVELSSVEYRLKGGRPKCVHYWAARVARSADEPAIAARGRVRPAGADEIDQVKWVPASRARRKLTRRKDRRPLDDLAARFRAGTLDTRAVAVLRHAAATPRAAWTAADGGEKTRPLTRAGKNQAKRLVPLLAAFGLVRVVSSPWKRCRATVKPYARAAGLARLAAPALTEEQGRQHPARAARLMVDVLAGRADGLKSSRGGVVVCTHRPVLPLLLTAVADACGPGFAARSGVPRQDPYLEPGEFLVAHVARRGPWKGRVVGVARHRP